MGFFKRSKKENNTSTSGDISATEWQSIASGSDSITLHSQSHHNDAATNNDDAATAWSKERSSQQLELEENIRGRRGKGDGDGGGCCIFGWTPMECLIRFLHVINLFLGIALLVYGSLLLTQFDQPAMAAVNFCFIFGTVHFVTSFVGLISLFLVGRKNNSCARMGLVVSAYSGPYFAAVYLTILISLLVDEKGFLMYLDDHWEVMYFGPNVAENFKRLLPLFYTILIVLGLLEGFRVCTLFRLRDRLKRQNEEESLIPQSLSSSNNNNNATSSSTAAAPGNSALTQALLEDDIETKSASASVAAAGGGKQGKETAETPNWWEK
mmetsp:Transcript_9349/g.20245  ORF Transcript_9349/g.20245 Transcript_9349/m.20245 type:complete len:324 (+) Transcript_9349:142-1113(+)